MLLATSYPLLDAFLTILEIVGFVLWIWLAISVFGDIFRSRDLSGPAKAIWILFVVILPLFGVLMYLLFRGGKMHERAVASAKAQDEAFRHYVQSVAGAGQERSPDGRPERSTDDRLAQLADLRDRGVINQDQYDAEKSRAVV